MTITITEAEARALARLCDAAAIAETRASTQDRTAGRFQEALAHESAAVEAVILSGRLDAQLRGVAA